MDDFLESKCDRFLVLVRMLAEKAGPSEIQVLQNALAVLLPRVHQSSKCSSGGIMADGEGAYMIFDKVQREEIMMLLGKELQSICRFEIHPIIGFDHIAKLMDNDN